MGSEAGHLASEQDRANWADRIRERVEMFARPRILHAFIVRLQMMGVLPEGDFEADWPDPFTLSPIERSQAFSNWARGLASAVKMFESGAILFTREEIREMGGNRPQEPDAGMGELPELDMSMFMPEENIQTARNRPPEPEADPNTADDDSDDASAGGQNSQTQRS